MEINLIVFDAKMKTYVNRKEYLIFLKKLQGLGYRKLQNSFYFRCFDNKLKANDSIVKVKQITPSTVYLSILTITEEKFNSIENINYSLPNIEKTSIICI